MEYKHFGETIPTLVSQVDAVIFSDGSARWDYPDIPGVDGPYMTPGGGDPDSPLLMGRDYAPLGWDQDYYYTRRREWTMPGPEVDSEVVGGCGIRHYCAYMEPHAGLCAFDVTTGDGYILIERLSDGRQALLMPDYVEYGELLAEPTHEWGPYAEACVDFCEQS